MARFSVTLKINDEVIRKTGYSTRQAAIDDIETVTVEVNEKELRNENDIDKLEIILRKKNRLGHKKYETFTSDFVKSKFEHSGSPISSKRKVEEIPF